MKVVKVTALVLLVSVAFLMFQCSLFRSEKTLTKDMPEWVYKGGGIFADKYTGIGCGIDKYFAFAGALYDLAGIISSTEIQSLKSINSEITKRNVEMDFGNIHLEGNVIVYSEEFYVEDDTVFTQLIEEVIIILYQNEEKKYSIKGYNDPNSIYQTKGYMKAAIEDIKNVKPQDQHRLEIMGENCSFDDVIDEMKSDGYTFETFVDGKDHYWMVCINIKDFKSKMDEK